MRPRRTALTLATLTLLLGGVSLGTAHAVPRPATGDSRTGHRPGTQMVPARMAVNSCPETVQASAGAPLPGSVLAATKIQDGFTFLEGPVWVKAAGTLMFSEMQGAAGPLGIQPSAIRSFTPPATFGTFVADSGTNGMAISPDGQKLLAATHDNQSVSSYSLATGTRQVVAANFQGNAFNSPNDLTVRHDGIVYFTDPNFQRGQRADQLGGVTGVYRVKEGVVTLVDGTLMQPNGVALSPDEKSLYVGATAENQIYKYSVDAHGNVSGRTKFVSQVTPDGVTVDCAGNTYWASFNEGLIHVYSPAGIQLGVISAGVNTTNAAFGGADRQTLYITSGVFGNFGLYSIRLNIPGNPY